MIARRVAEKKSKKGKLETKVKEKPNEDGFNDKSQKSELKTKIEEESTCKFNQLYSV